MSLQRYAEVLEHPNIFLPLRQVFSVLKTHTRTLHGFLSQKCLCKVRVAGTPCTPKTVKMESKKGATSANTQKAKGGCLQHNRRTQMAANVDPSRTRLNTWWEHDRIKNLASTRSLIRRAEKLYTEKTGQKCQATFAPLKETCVVCKDSTTMEQAMAIAKKVEQQTGVVCLGIWIHRDEGHARSRFNPDEPYQCNNHIHILWDCQNPTTGKSIPIKRQDLRDMQDIAANALGMERGNPAEQTKKNHINSGTYKVQQLQAEIKQLKKERTGLVAKIQDSWKWKGRAKKAETNLEAERKAHKDDIAKANKIITETKKMAEIEKKRANSAENECSNLREKNEELYQENHRLSVVAKHWKGQYDETIGKQLGQDAPKRGRGR